MNIIVATSDKHNWCLRPFAYLFNKYWSPYQRVTIAGYTPPDFTMPSNFHFISIAQPEYPKEKWADGILRLLNTMIEVSEFILFLEDYWLSRPVDVEGVKLLYDFLKDTPDVLRMDLGADRLYAGGMMDIGYLDRFDLISAPDSQYEMSLQLSVWKTKLFIDVLEGLKLDQRSAWGVEIYGTGIVNSNRMRVYGTRQRPVRWANGCNNAIGDKAILDGLTMKDIAEIMPLIPDKYK